MLIQLFEGLCDVLFNKKIQHGFEAFLIFAAWLLTIFLLAVSLPHGFDILLTKEQGDWREFKAIALDLVVEIIPAFLILTAFHSTSLPKPQRNFLIGLSVPFVVLVGHIQLSYYAKAQNWNVPIYPWELALILPYAICVCALVVAFLWPHLAGARDKLLAAIDEAIAKERESWEVTVLEKDQQINRLGEELAYHQKELGETKRLLQAPDPERARLSQELETKKRELAVLSQAKENLNQELGEARALLANRIVQAPDREAIRAEILKPYKDGKSNQGDTLDKLMALFGEGGKVA